MTCGSCGRVAGHGDVFIGMAPGRDGLAWSLCARCWAPAPKAIGRTPKPTAKRPDGPGRGGLL